jgi:hypothetical protein
MDERANKILEEEKMQKEIIVAKEWTHEDV